MKRIVFIDGAPRIGKTTYLDSLDINYTKGFGTSDNFQDEDVMASTYSMVLVNKYLRSLDYAKQGNELYNKLYPNGKGLNLHDRSLLNYLTELVMHNVIAGVGYDFIKNHCLSFNSLTEMIHVNDTYKKYILDECTLIFKGLTDLIEDRDKLTDYFHNNHFILVQDSLYDHRKYNSIEATETSFFNHFWDITSILSSLKINYCNCDLIDFYNQVYLTFAFLFNLDVIKVSSTSELTQQLGLIYEKHISNTRSI